MRRMVRPNAKVELDIYDDSIGTKYSADAEKLRRVTYDDVVSFETIPHSGRALDIERATDCVDPYHEYLILYFKDGNTSTFRNSYVDLFIW